MPRANVKDKRKQQLMDANIASIAKRGLVDTTITHVAEGANLSRGIVNFYFDSKEKMMQETLAYILAEQTACWQGALSVPEANVPQAKIQSVLRMLMGDKLCTVRRLAALMAFMGHAGTHVAYARQINAADELFTKQIKHLWQQAGLDAKAAELRARQMLAVIRGHHMMTFLNAEGGKPSAYASAWEERLMDISAPAASVAASAPASKIADTKQPDAKVQELKPKKINPLALPGQMDFGDLFSRT